MQQLRFDDRGGGVGKRGEHMKSPLGGWEGGWKRQMGWDCWKAEAST